MPHHILVADDDPHIRDVIRFSLEKVGMRVDLAEDGARALQIAEGGRPDLIILDIGMPELDGLEVCRRLRRTSDVPILFLSARDEEIDRVLGLELGGDDYVTKPFSPRELVARVNAILKRAQAPAAVPTPVLRRGSLTLDAGAHLVVLGDTELGLTALEFAILHALLVRPRMVFSREQILEATRNGAVHVADRTIDSHVRNIRAKFLAGGCPSVIETIHGVGFRIGRCETAT
jgi:two-component system, OmpR family, response regulator